IASDGNLLPECLDADHVRIMPAERGDIIIDFSKYPVGSKLYLVNRLDQLDGRGPTNQLLMPGTPVLRFDVTREPPKPDASVVPAVLRKLSPVNLAMVKRERHIRLERENGVWVINGKIYDGEKPLFTCKRGELEKWTFQNSSGWSHPLHIHLDEGRIISRNGKPPPPRERGRKDMYELRPGEELSLVIRFADFTGKYVVHCHNLVHEDHHMMIRFDVV
ncbi:MAG: multicopper oxidase family protein, partial [Noviherbaspirillum sp.]